MGKLFFIINPLAGNGYGNKVWHIVERELKKMAIPYSSFLSEYRGHAKEFVQSLIENEEQQINLVVIGGDGTLNEVINGIANDTRVRLGFIPGGSGNDFSRGFQIPKEPIEALNTLISSLNRETESIDVGFYTSDTSETTFFINNMGTGFDALICKDVNSSMMKKWLNRLSMGKLIYVYSLLKRLFTYQCTDLQLTVDGKVYHFHSTWFVAIANQPYYGGGMKIAPLAKTTDGILNITVVNNLSRLKLLLVFISVFWGGHTTFKEVHSLVGKQISVYTSSPTLIHVDGEVTGSTPAQITVNHKVLSLLR